MPREKGYYMETCREPPPFGQHRRAADIFQMELN